MSVKIEFSASTSSELIAQVLDMAKSLNQITISPQDSFEFAPKGSTIGQTIDSPVPVQPLQAVEGGSTPAPTTTKTRGRGAAKAKEETATAVADTTSAATITSPNDFLNTPAPAAAAVAVVVATTDDAKNILSDLITAKGMLPAKAILSKFKTLEGIECERISQIPNEKLGEFVSQCKQAIG